MPDTNEENRKLKWWQLLIANMSIIMMVLSGLMLLAAIIGYNDTVFSDGWTDEAIKTTVTLGALFAVFATLTVVSFIKGYYRKVDS